MKTIEFRKDNRRDGVVVGAGVGKRFNRGPH